MNRFNKIRMYGVKQGFWASTLFFGGVIVVMGLELNWRYQVHKNCDNYARNVEFTRDSLWVTYTFKGDSLEISRRLQELQPRP